MSEKPTMHFNKFQKNIQNWGNLWVKRQRSLPSWGRKRTGIWRRSYLHSIIREEGNKICLIYLNYWSLQWSGHRQKVCTYLFIYRNTSKKKRRKSYDLRFVTRRRISLRMDSLLGGSGILEHEILRPEILFYSWHIFGNVYLFDVRSKKFNISLNLVMCLSIDPRLVILWCNVGFSWWMISVVTANVALKNKMGLFPNFQHLWRNDTCKVLRSTIMFRITIVLSLLK